MRLSKLFQFANLLSLSAALPTPLVATDNLPFDTIAEYQNDGSISFSFLLHNTGFAGFAIKPIGSPEGFSYLDADTYYYPNKETVLNSEVEASLNYIDIYGDADWSVSSSDGDGIRVDIKGFLDDPENPYDYYSATFTVSLESSLQSTFNEDMYYTVQVTAPSESSVHI